MTTTPNTMRAIAIAAPGAPDALRIADVPRPTPAAGEVLIRVAAAGVNRPDVLQRKGLYPAPKGHSTIPGLEVAGHIASLGEGTSRWRVGDAVLALVNGGGYAEFVTAHEGATLKMPPALSMDQAAAIPETFFTVWHNVVERGALKSGERFLVHGGTSGIGVAAIQVAKLIGAHVTTTAGSDAKCQACLSLGADRAINYQTEDFANVIKNDTAGRGVDVILDMVGGDYIARNIRCLADDGRLVNIAYQKGSEATIDFMRVMLKRLTITGSTLRIRTDAVKASIAAEVERHVLPAIVDGRVKILIDSTFSLEDAAKAHELMESSTHIGKIVLTM